MKTNTKTTLWVMLICTPIGELWGWLHCQIGAKSGWIFPPDSWFGIEFCGMILEDWLFYPITGYFFVQVILFDPLKLMFGRRFPLKRFSVKRNNLAKALIHIVLLALTVLPIFIFGKSGQLTALFFGCPSIIIWYFIEKEFDIYHFLRTGLIIVPIEFIWDHIAVGVFNQWVYIRDAGIWGNLWINGLPCEMSPYLGFMSLYFIFSMVILVKKKVEQK